MAKDPVCNNEIDLEDIRYQSRLHGDVYWFDSPECKDLFDANPKRYIGEGHIPKAEEDRKKRRQK